MRAILKPIVTSAKAATAGTSNNNGYTQKSTSSSVYDKGYAQRLETGNYTAVYDASEKVYRYAPQPSNWNIGVINYFNRKYIQLRTTGARIVGIVKNRHNTAYNP